MSFQCFPHFSNPTINTINLASTGWSWAAIRPIKGATPFVELLLRSRALASVSQGNDDLGKLFLTLAILKRKFWNTSLGKTSGKRMAKGLNAVTWSIACFVLTWSNKIKCPKMLLQLPVVSPVGFKVAVDYPCYTSFCPTIVLVVGRILMWFPCPLAAICAKGADPTLMTRNNLSAVDLARPRGWPGAKQVDSMRTMKHH